MVEQTGETRTKLESALPGAALLALAAATFGRLPALGAFWNQSDWRMLARATGLLDGDGFTAHAFAQTVYWQAFYPLFDLATYPWAWTRILLHAATAALLVRIARRSGLTLPSALLAGLLFGATPLAFAPLYHAVGAHQLLGACLGLLAIERLLAGRTAALVTAALAGVLALLSDTVALALPVLIWILALGGDRHRRSGRVVVAVVLTIAALVEAWLLQARPGPDPFSAAGALSGEIFVIDLVQYAWWLITPGPFHAAEATLFTGLGGLLAWTLWLTWARRAWRKDERKPALWLTASLLALLPALILRPATQPHLAYLAFAPAALTFGHALLGGRERLRPAIALIMAILAAATAWTAMEIKLHARGGDGRPSDPLVLHTAMSNESLSMLDAVNTGPARRIFILQTPSLTPDPERLATAPDLPLTTPLHTALAGRLGPALHGRDDRRVDWTRRLGSVPLDAVVFADSGHRLVFWGPVPQAFIYETLVEIGRGRYDDAAARLRQGMRNSKTTMALLFDESQLPVPIADVKARAEGFMRHLQVSDQVAPGEREALLTTARELLARCCASP